MTVCESCGANFDVASLPTEINSTRVLCTRCYWKHQAEKAAKKGGVAASGAPTAPTVVARAAVKPAVKPEVKPAVKPEVKPAVKPSRPSADDSKRGARGDRKVAKEAPARALPVNPDDAPLLDATTKRLAIVAVVFVVLAGGIYWKVKGQQQDEAAVESTLATKKRDLLAALKSFDAVTVDGANRIVGMVDSTRDTWVASDIATEVTALKNKAAAFIGSEQTKRDYFDRLSAIEGAGNDLGSKTAQEARELKRRVEGIAREALDFGSDAQSRATTLKSRIEQAISGKVKEEAVAYCDQQGATDPSGALNKLAIAEDEIRALWDKAFADKNAAMKTLLSAYLQELIAKADALATTHFTDAEKEKTPWRELLVGDAVSEWKAGATKGFEHKIEAGVLRVKGPAEDARGLSVLSIGDQQRWRDFVIEGEFTIEKGAFSLCFRLGSAPNQNTDVTKIEAEEGGPIAPGGTYSFTYEVVGSSVKMHWKDDVAPAEDRVLMWNYNRSGAFGLVIEREAALKFSRLRIRELR